MIKNGVALKDSLSKTKVVLETITVENKSKKVETNFVENVLKASFVSFTWKEVQQFKIRQKSTQQSMLCISMFVGQNTGIIKLTFIAVQKQNPVFSLIGN